jgi:Zn finger protein HypA/HybF involved in hydrogenase expression
MWTCRHCGLEVMCRAVDPQIDNDGCFFVCPGCQARNKLINVGRGGPRDPIELAQPDL